MYCIPPSFFMECSDFFLFLRNRVILENQSMGQIVIHVVQETDSPRFVTVRGAFSLPALRPRLRAVAAFRSVLLLWDFSVGLKAR